MVNTGKFELIPVKKQKIECSVAKRRMYELRNASSSIVIQLLFAKQARGSINCYCYHLFTILT